MSTRENIRLIARAPLLHLGGSRGLLVYPSLLISLPLPGRSLGMTEILLTMTS